MSRELERGTLPLAWMLGGSRRRWLAIRLGVLLGFLVLAFVPLGLVMDRLESARIPTIDAAQSFQHDGMRGWQLPARGVAAFALTALIGLVLGRQVPAIIVGVIASVAIALGAYFMVDDWARQVAEPRPNDVLARADRWVETRLRSRADGSWVSFEAAYAMQPPNDDDGSWFDETFEYISFAVPGARYGESEFIGSAVLLGGTALSSFIGLWLVERRRAT